MSLWTELLYPRHRRFYCLFSLLFLILLLRYSFQIDIPRISLAILIACIAILGDRDELLAITMCCIPFHESIDFFYSIAACTATLILRNFRYMRINLAVVLILEMFSWELLHCFSASFSIVTFLVSIFPLVVLAVILCVDISKMDYAFIGRVFSVATSAIGTILLVKLVVQADFDIVSAINGLRRLGQMTAEAKSESLTGTFINPNTLGILCVLALTTLLQIRNVRLNKPIDALLMIILLVLGTLTSSRTFLVCLTTMLLLQLFGQEGSVQKKLHFLLSMILILVLAVLTLNHFFPNLMIYYFGRFVREELTGGRMNLMVVYHRYILENPNIMLFGIGLQNYGERLAATFRMDHPVPHNSVQEIIIAWGLPGLILFALLILTTIRTSKKYAHRHMLQNYIPLIILLLKSVAGQLLTSSYSLLALSYAYLSLCQDFRPKAEQ